MPYGAGTDFRYALRFLLVLTWRMAVQCATLLDGGEVSSRTCLRTLDPIAYSHQT